MFVTVVAPAEVGRASRAGSLAAAQERSAAIVRHWWPVLAVALLVGVRRAELPWDDGDVLWAIRTGQDTIRTGLPHVDVYSWTARGAAWLPNSWGWNVVLAGAYACAGLVGVALLAVAMLAGLGGAVSASARRLGATPVATALVLQAVVGVSMTFFYARAQLVDYVAVVLLPLLARRALVGQQGRAPSGGIGWEAVGWLAVAQIVWMNLHTTAVVGPLLVASYGVGLAMAQRRFTRARVALRAVALTAVCAVCCLVTPYGTAPLGQLTAVRAASAGLVAEWQPIGLGDPLQLLDVLLVGAATAAGVLAWRARRYESVAVLVVVAGLAVTAVRFAPMAGLAAVPELAAALSRIEVRRSFLRRTLAVTTGLMLAWTATGTGVFGAPGGDYYAPSLVAAVPPHCRLLDDYDIGGDVVLQRRDVAVSIDGRNDLYGRARELRQLAAWNDAAAGTRYVARHRVDCVLGPATTPLARALSRTPAWTVTAREGARVLLVRRPVLSPAPRPLRRRVAAAPR